MKNDNKLFVGFWKNGKKNGFGKIMTKHKTKYGLWNNDDKITWFKNEKEAFLYLDENNMNYYKKIYNYSKRDIIYFIEQNYSDKNIDKFENNRIINEYLKSEGK